MANRGRRRLQLPDLTVVACGWADRSHRCFHLTHSRRKLRITTSSARRDDRLGPDQVFLVIRVNL
jgi:hypothetical protein